MLRQQLSQCGALNALNDGQDAPSHRSCTMPRLKNQTWLIFCGESWGNVCCLNRRTGDTWQLVQDRWRGFGHRSCAMHHGRRAEKTAPLFSLGSSKAGKPVSWPPGIAQDRWLLKNYADLNASSSASDSFETMWRTCSPCGMDSIRK